MLSPSSVDVDIIIVVDCRVGCAWLYCVVASMIGCCRVIVVVLIVAISPVGVRVQSIRSSPAMSVQRRRHLELITLGP